MAEPVRPLILNDAEIASVAPSLAEIAAIVAETYRLDGEGGVEVPSKIGVHPDFRNSFCHAMPAWVPAQRALGMKWVSYFPGIDAQGLPDSTGIILLNDPDRGLPVAIMEGMWITYARTTACAAVMARTLAVAPPRVLALVGCGGLGTWMVRMAAATLPEVETILVTSRTAASRDAFCDRMRAETGLDIRPVATPRDAVAAADLIVSSIPPPDAPFIEAGWLRPGALAVPLDYFHCYTPGAVQAMQMLATDDTVKIAPLLARLAGDRAPPLHAFGAIAAGQAAAGRDPARPAMALPTGVASTDMTVAWEIYRRARAADLGVAVTLTVR
jgi:ornithine cyclodeaminase/alanine dehydrogenase-like protein (mu-crystallin family)